MNADAGEFTGGVDLHLLELPRIHEAGVGVIKGIQHSPDRLVGIFGIAVALGEDITTHRLPFVLAVVPSGVEVVAEDNLPSLIHHLLGTVGNDGCSAAPQHQIAGQHKGPSQAAHPGKSDEDNAAQGLTGHKTAQFPITVTSNS